LGLTFKGFESKDDPEGREERSPGEIGFLTDTTPKGRDSVFSGKKVYVGLEMYRKVAGKKWGTEARERAKLIQAAEGQAHIGLS